jgi:hypothetical protein
MPNDASPSVRWNDQDHAPAQLALRLAALAREARLLEFAVEGDGDSASSLASSLESALERAMEAMTSDELVPICEELSATLDEVVARGMSLSAELTDVLVEGVLGASHMPALSAVLKVPERQGT